jgi:hypothetical protein
MNYIENMILSYELISIVEGDIIDSYLNGLSGLWREVIPVREAGFGSVAEAAEMLDAALDYLAATDWASLGTQAHREMLVRLQRVQARLTAASATVLGAFTAQAGHEADGHRSGRAWLVNQTGISTGAASGAVGWQKNASSATPRSPP